MSVFDSYWVYHQISEYKFFVKNSLEYNLYLFLCVPYTESLSYRNIDLIPDLIPNLIPYLIEYWLDSWFLIILIPVILCWLIYQIRIYISCDKILQVCTKIYKKISEPDSRITLIFLVTSKVNNMIYK